MTLFKKTTIPPTQSLIYNGKSDYISQDILLERAIMLSFVVLILAFFALSAGWCIIKILQIVI